MKNILIISNFIPPEHSATGRIAYSIAKELGKRNYVHLLCLSSNEIVPDCDGIKANKLLTRYGRYKKRVQNAENKRGLSKIFAKISYKLYYKYAKRKGLEDSKSHLRFLIKQAKAYIRQHNIDTLITVSNPFDLQLVGHSVRKKCPQIKWFPYLMDSNRHNISYNAKRDKEREILSLAEKLLIVPALCFDEDFCQDFNEKLEVVDLPIIPTDKPIEASQGDGVKLLFAGMFYKDVRDPKPLLDLMIRLPENYSLELYYGGCADIVKAYKNVLGARLSAQGFISPQELEEKMSSANLLVNIGNTVLNQVSSKAYDLIATGKPILNFYQNEKDISLGHLRCYPLCYSMDYRNIEAGDISTLMKWVDEVDGETLDYEKATERLQEKRLESVARRIEQIIQLSEGNL